MNTNVEKRTYNTPRIEQIILDNEISLILESLNSDPGEPGYSSSGIIPEYLNNDPFKITLC